jgi:glycosyltransferase involved in cell wall biosynthesis
VVQVARLTPIKNQDVLLKAAAPLNCEVILVGDTAEGYSTDYRETLKALASELGMAQRVTFTGRQSPEQVREWYQHATAAINLSPPGLFDKAALEAMACGLPTIVSNEAFNDLTGPQQKLLNISAPDDVEGLREHLRTILALTPLQRQQIGQQLRQGVVADHSLQQLAKKVISVLRTGEVTSR